MYSGTFGTTDFEFYCGFGVAMPTCIPHAYMLFKPSCLLN